MNYFVCCFLCLSFNLLFSYPSRLYSVAKKGSEAIPQWTVQVGAHEGISNALGLPMIGIYGTPYNFRGVAVVQNTTHLLEGAPETVKNLVKNKNVNYYTMFWGSHLYGKDNKADNIVLHPVVRRWQLAPDWRGSEDHTSTNFNTSVPVGIFGATANVRPEDIASNQLKPLAVNYHDRIYFSPNNGHVKLPVGENEVATFWLVIQDPIHVNNMIVTFNIVLNGESGYQMLQDIEKIEQWNYINTFEQLRRLPTSNSSAWNQALTLIEDDFNYNEAGVPTSAPAMRQDMSSEEIGAKFFEALDKRDWSRAEHLISLSIEKLGAETFSFFRDAYQQVRSRLIGEQAEAGSSSAASSSVMEPPSVSPQATASASEGVVKETEEKKIKLQNEIKELEQEKGRLDAEDRKYKYSRAKASFVAGHPIHQWRKDIGRVNEALAQKRAELAKLLK